MIARVDPAIPEIQSDEKLVKLRIMISRQLTIQVIKSITNICETSGLVSCSVTSKAINEELFSFDVVQHSIVFNHFNDAKQNECGARALRCGELGAKSGLDESRHHSNSL